MVLFTVFKAKSSKQNKMDKYCVYIGAAITYYRTDLLNLTHETIFTNETSSPFGHDYCNLRHV